MKLKLFVWRGRLSEKWYGDIGPADWRPKPGLGLGCVPDIDWVTGITREEATAKGLAKLEELLAAELERQDP